MPRPLACDEGRGCDGVAASTRRELCDALLGTGVHIVTVTDAVTVCDLALRVCSCTWAKVGSLKSIYVKA